MKPSFFFAAGLLLFPAANLNAEVVERPDLSRHVGELRPIFPGTPELDWSLPCDDEVCPPVVELTGDIREGDAGKLLEMLRLGMKVALNFEGGDWDEAMKIAAELNSLNSGEGSWLFDNLIVLDGARCAGACAALFIAAGGSQIESGGILDLSMPAGNRKQRAQFHEWLARQLEVQPPNAPRGRPLARALRASVLGGDRGELTGDIDGWHAGLVPMSRGPEAALAMLSDLRMEQVALLCNSAIWNGPRSEISDGIRASGIDAMDSTTEFNPHFFEFDNMQSSVVGVIGDTAMSSAGSAGLTFPSHMSGGFNSIYYNWGCSITALGTGGFWMDVKPDTTTCSELGDNPTGPGGLCPAETAAQSELTLGFLAASIGCGRDSEKEWLNFVEAEFFDSVKAWFSDLIIGLASQVDIYDPSAVHAEASFQSPLRKVYDTGSGGELRLTDQCKYSDDLLWVEVENSATNVTGWLTFENLRLNSIWPLLAIRPG